MKRLEEVGMTLNRSKCVFFKNEVIFLGYRVLDKGIVFDLEKVKVIIKMRVLINRKELKSFFRDGELF